SPLSAALNAFHASDAGVWSKELCSCSGTQVARAATKVQASKSMAVQTVLPRARLGRCSQEGDACSACSEPRASGPLRSGKWRPRGDASSGTPLRLFDQLQISDPSCYDHVSITGERPHRLLEFLISKTPRQVNRPPERRGGAMLGC